MIRLNLFMIWFLHFISLLSVICRYYRQNSSSRIIVVLVYTVSTHFLLISPDFRGGGRKGEDISCLVVKSGKCYQRKGNGEVVSLGFLL